MTEAIPAFIAAMASAGISPISPIAGQLASGALVRFRADGDKPGRKNGWAILYLDGIPAGAFGHYRLGVRSAWRSGAITSLSLAEQHAIRRRIAEAEAKRREAIQTAASRAKAVWKSASIEIGAHPYLIGKCLRSFGIRRSGTDLLVPLVDPEYRMWNLQRIAPDGLKRFAKDGRTAGVFWPLGVNLVDGRPSNGPLVIGEGFATMAAIHEATGFGVVAAMSANNLLSVALALRRAFPDRELILAADHDGHLSRNIGLESASEAAGRVRGALALPLAAGADSSLQTRGIDFADIPRDQVAARIAAARQGN